MNRTLAKLFLIFGVCGLVFSGWSLIYYNFYHQSEDVPNYGYYLDQSDFPAADSDVDTDTEKSATAGYWQSSAIWTYSAGPWINERDERQVSDSLYPYSYEKRSGGLVPALKITAEEFSYKSDYLIAGYNKDKSDLFGQLNVEMPKTSYKKWSKAGLTIYQESHELPSFEFYPYSLYRSLKEKFEKKDN